jgi:AhpD family alkylhydroperoxidase
MSQRMRIVDASPAGFRTVYALEQFCKDNVDGRLLNLVKLRASVINGCSFCVDMHGTHMLEDGEDVRRVLAVSAWREAEMFTPREQAALDLTDAVTRLGDHGVSDDVWAAAAAEFGEEDLANLLVAIATINVWNRLQVTTRTPPPPLEDRTPAAASA